MIKFQNKKIDIACINVVSNQERHNLMMKQAADYNIPIRFFKAIIPDTRHLVPNNYADWRTRLWWGRALIPTEQACCLSHLQLWRDFLASDNDYIIIFEDDAKIEPDFMENLQQFLKCTHIPDFVKFSGQHERPKKFIEHIKTEKNHQLFLNAYGPLDATCYLLSKKGAERLETYCNKMHMAIDVLMDRTFEHKVPCYTVRPYLARAMYPQEIESQIGDEDRKNKYDHKNIFLQLLTRLLRSYSSFRKRFAEMTL